MATVDEMVNMVNTMDDEDRGRIAETVWGNPGSYSSLAMGLMYHALRNAIEGGRNFGEGGWNGDLGKDFPRADEASGWIDKNLHRFA